MQSTYKHDKPDMFNNNYNHNFFFSNFRRFNNNIVRPRHIRTDYNIIIYTYILSYIYESCRCSRFTNNIKIIIMIISGPVSRIAFVDILFEYENLYYNPFDVHALVFGLFAVVAAHTYIIFCYLPIHWT